MKKKLTISVGVFFWGSVLLACDVCGNMSSGNFSGMWNMQNQTFFGLQHHYNAFNTSHPTLFSNEIPTKSSEYFQTIEAYGRLRISDKFQVFGAVPVKINRRNEQKKLEIVYGLGDIYFLTNYVLINQNDSTKKLQYQVNSGIGIKFPTGSYIDENNADHNLIRNMQPGTGSLDYLARMNVQAKYKQWLANLDIPAAVNGVSKGGYKFGNRITPEIQVARSISLKRIAARIIPNLGYTADYVGKDYDKYQANILNPFSGGYFKYFTTGVDILTSKLALSLKLYHPNDQQYADGLVINTIRFKGSITLFFGK